MRTNKYLSIRLARILMKLIGYWPAESKREKKFLNGLLVYTLFAVALALWIEATELYLGTGDFYAITYTLCTATPVIIILLKLSFFLRHREEMLGMLKYTEDNFWYVQYDAYGSRILERIDRKGIILLFTFTFFVQGAVFTYMLAPIIGLLNMHTAGQFKMLQHRLETIFQNIERKDSVEFFDGKREHQVFEEIIECVTIHRKLIWYSERMEYFFMYTTLAQLLVSSVLLCVSGLQIFLGHNMTIVRRMIFVAHAIACFFQLFLVTCTSNDLIDESRAIGDAAYNANWQVLSHDNNKGVRNAVLMIMIRAMRPCSISAGGFFPVSLETFMTVLSTAVSYFTLLRKFLGEQGI
ncbi:odorant receptor 13a-like isoform X2 [Polyergus mexicanus]|uniref:odorant receptor 13a-like isoform X2 n=1 Tax=Polyergus mexicanus TaxID=615972 RepID=UPI0038B4D525